MKIFPYFLLFLAFISQSYSLSFPKHKEFSLFDLLYPARNSLPNTALNFLANNAKDGDWLNANFNSDDDSDDIVPIMELEYYGSWKSTSSEYIQQFTTFSKSSGFALFVARDTNKSGYDNNILFEFYDGDYVDQKYSIISIFYDNSTDFHPENSTIQNSSIVFELYTGVGNSDPDKIQNCSGSYQITFWDSKANTTYNMSTTDYEDTVAYFWLNSTNCSISISATVSISSSQRSSQALYYSLMITLVCLCHLYATYQLIRNISQNEHDGGRYSLITISFFTIWDVFMCLFHLYNALTTQDFFHYFITPAFWYFILASIFETRLLLIVWKTRYYQGFQTINDVRRGITVFYLKFYGGMLASLALAYNFFPANWLMGVTAGFFVPQIVHNAMRGQRFKFDPLYIFMLGAMRIITPVYVRGCPDSIFKLTPSEPFVIFYISFVALQIIFLFLQSKFGSRFFIPAMFLPPKYNYYVKIPCDAPAEEADTCSICMETLNEPPIVSTTTLLSSRPSTVTIMTTPCNHKFHPTCLQQWMEIKLECPFCRTAIPPLD